MISGTKISQLPVLTELQDTDYFPVVRGINTRRISGLTISNATLSAVKNAIPVNYISNTLILSATNTDITTNILNLTGTQVIEANSSDAALRVTQTGTGNALLVEDSANPDSTPFVITSAGDLGVGTTAPTSKLHVVGTVVSDTALKTPKLTNSTETGYIMLSAEDGSFRFYSNNDEILTILSGGNIGISVIEPNEALTISGNVSANVVYANLSGNAETSSKWQTPRQVTLSGSIYGNTSLDGTQDVTIYTTISTGVITNQNISDTASISDIKLATITTPQKVQPGAIDYAGSQYGDVLTSTGSNTVWRSISSIDFIIGPGSITTEMLENFAVTEAKIENDAVVTSKLSAQAVTTAKIANSAITTEKILDGAVTIVKAGATAAATPTTIVSRDATGNLSAVEVTASLKGNAQTASKLQTPRTLNLSGDLFGQVAFDGSQDVTLFATTVRPETLNPWVVYNAAFQNNLSATYIQGDPTTQSYYVTATHDSQSTRSFNQSATFLQQNEFIYIDITLPETSDFSIFNVDDFYTFNLAPGNALSATFTNEQAITGTSTPLFDGEYTVVNLYGTTTTGSITLTSTTSQYISGDVEVSFNEIFFNPEHNLQEGHIINVKFLTGEAIDGGSHATQASGQYVVIDVPNTETFVLSTTTFQSASGQLLMYRCYIVDSYDVSNVTYLDTGNHILNFRIPFENNRNYGFTGSNSHDSTVGPNLTGVYMTSVIHSKGTDTQDRQNLEIKTVLNYDNALSYQDFIRTNISCFGY